MAVYKYIANRALTLLQNLMLAHKLSEYHTGCGVEPRSFGNLTAGSLLRRFHFFDNQMLVMAIHRNFRVGEISCPARYFPEASSINLRRSIVYGLGVLLTSTKFRLHRMRLIRSKLFTEADPARRQGK
jgi:hypothetical protein